MSSLSQEDLDAGWDALDVAGAAAPKLRAQEALPRTSSPPNSMTFEVTPARVESLVIPAASPALEASELIAAADESLTQMAAAPVETMGVPLLAPDSGPPTDRAESPNMQESSEFEWPPFEQMSHVVASALGSFEVVAERPELFEVSHTHPLPLSASSSAFQGNHVAFLEALASGDPTPPAARTEQAAVGEPETLGAAGDPGEHESAPPESMQVATAQTNVSPVTEVAFLESRVAIEPDMAATQETSAAGESAPSASAVASPASDDATATQPEPAGKDAPASNAHQGSQPQETSATARHVALLESRTASDHRTLPATVELVSDSTSAVAVETREVAADTEQLAVSRPGWSRPRRLIAWGAAAAIGLIAGYLVLHAMYSAQHTDESAQPMRQQANVVPKVQSLQKSAPPAAAELPRGVEPALSAGNSAALNKAPAEAAAPKPLGESFSDAFVKHAASANSNWADVKKRPRSADTASANRPTSPGASKTGDNPLNLLDQLEKARKAKKQAASRP